jgi:hypothetical protein
MIYPNMMLRIKKCRYSGTIQVWPGDHLVWMPDGSVKTFREVWAGAATSNKNGVLSWP